MLSGHALSFWITYGALSLSAKPAYMPLSKEDCSDELWYQSYQANATSGHYPGAQYSYIPATPFQHELYE
jgi:hypothetical protein